jgi:hypothetical protein
VRELRAALLGVCAFGVVYLGVAMFRLPTLAYDPVARTVSFTAELRGLSMRYYGDLLWACAAALSAAALSLRLRLSSRTDAPLTAGALSLVCLEVAYYLSRLFAAV